MGIVSEARWTIIIPVKPPAIGKSRLRGSAPRGVVADALVEAIALDTIAAACRIGADIVVVTAAKPIATAATALGARVLAEPDGGGPDGSGPDGSGPDGSGPDGGEAGREAGRPCSGGEATGSAGLNAAIRHGEAMAGRSGWRAAMAADLPALRPDELGEALAGAVTLGAGRAYVADHHGIGTTLLSASPGVPLGPAFGGASARAHAASGAAALPGRWPSLRLDVDTAADLVAAMALGLGARTGHARQATWQAG